MAGRLVAGTLADRGARNPDALATFIASRARSGGRVIGLAGGDMTCPQCGYSGSSDDFSDNDEDDNGGSEALRTPAPSTGYVRDGAPLTVRGGGSAPGLANTEQPALDLATPRYPVTSPMDLLISNSPNGGALVRHRRGGSVIGEVHENGGWRAVYGGKEHTPRSHQRAALADLLGLWNAGTATLQHEATPLQPPPEQTPLMQQYGVPAIRALATPATSVSDGPRVTGASDDDDSSGLSGRSASVYKKLVAKGWDKARARKFAANSSRFGGGSS
jgi:hypothetical protein